MNRRRFNKAAMAAFLGHGLLGGHRARSAESDAQLDRFGGWKGTTFEATGFFRTEHDGNRWWLVTPEGNAFLSFGINHLHSDLWRQDFNREAWQRSLVWMNCRTSDHARPVSREHCRLQRNVWNDVRFV